MFSIVSSTSRFNKSKCTQRHLKWYGGDARAHFLSKTFTSPTAYLLQANRCQLYEWTGRQRAQPQQDGFTRDITQVGTHALVKRLEAQMTESSCSAHYSLAKLFSKAIGPFKALSLMSNTVAVDEGMILNTVSVDGVMRTPGDRK